MRDQAPFQYDDLQDLDACFLSRAARVVALEDVLDGERAPNVLGLRHDCDNADSLATAVKMARWEQEHGYRSSYYILHTAPYWDYVAFPEMLDEIAAAGHEIGLHNNALAEAIRTGENPDRILERALTRLRGLGYRVRGTAGHGDPLCSYDAGPGEPWFANDEIFTECKRRQVGRKEVKGGERILSRGNSRLHLVPRPLADFGLEYEALWLGHPYPYRFSDSGGHWTEPGWATVADQFAQQAAVSEPPRSSRDPRQLHMLVHPDWWSEAFTPQKAAV